MFCFVREWVPCQSKDSSRMLLRGLQKWGECSRKASRFLLTSPSPGSFFWVHLPCLSGVSLTSLHPGFTLAPGQHFLPVARRASSLVHLAHKTEPHLLCPLYTMKPSVLKDRVWHTVGAQQMFLVLKNVSTEMMIYHALSYFEHLILWQGGVSPFHSFILHSTNISRARAMCQALT